MIARMRSTLARAVRATTRAYHHHREIQRRQIAESMGVAPGIIFVGADALLEGSTGGAEHAATNALRMRCELLSQAVLLSAASTLRAQYGYDHALVTTMNPQEVETAVGLVLDTATHAALVCGSDTQLTAEDHDQSLDITIARYQARTVLRATVPLLLGADVLSEHATEDTLVQMF